MCSHRMPVFSGKATFTALIRGNLSGDFQSWGVGPVLLANHFTQGVSVSILGGLG